MPERYFALIPAAGGGTRLGAPIPKQYLEVDGRTLLEHAAFALLAHPRIERVFVVLTPLDERFARIRWGGDVAREARVAPLFCGGPSRAASVRNGLVAAGDVIDLDDGVLVHDAARPCLPQADLDRLIDTVGEDEAGGILAVPVADTVKRADAGGRIERTLDRAGLWRALTPQLFRYGTLLRGYAALDEAALDRITDEAALIEQLGLHPRLVPGSPVNIKVTYPDDLTDVARWLGSRGRERT